MLYLVSLVCQQERRVGPRVEEGIAGTEVTRSYLDIDLVTIKYLGGMQNNIYFDSCHRVQVWVEAAVVG